MLKLTELVLSKVKRWTAFVPGMTLCLAIAGLSRVMGNHLSGIEAVVVAILIGTIIGNTLGIKDVLKEGVKFSAQPMLKLSIVLLGFGLNFKDIVEVGPKMAMIVVLLIASTLALSFLLSKLLNISPKVAALIGVGSSICGVSAVAAVAPAIEADKDSTTIAVAIISTLGGLCLMLFSLLAFYIPLSDLQYGVWAGTSLQGVAHAVAAAFIRGESSGELGTIVKMTRVVLLAPVTLILSNLFGARQDKKIQFPPYVVLFIIIGVIATFGVIPTQIIKLAKTINSWLIIISMAAMGLEVNLRMLKNQATKALLIGIILFGFISSLSYVLINAFL